MTIFIELSLVVILATAVSLIMRLLRQPLIVGYILTGIIAGPYVLGVLDHTEPLELFSKIGIAILLFMVGLHLNPMVIKEVGKVSVFTGLGQVALTTAAGFFIMQSLGFDTLPSLYTGIALGFSSTIIILKLLSDQGDLNKLYGRISIGMLLVEDIIATVVLVVVTTLSATTTTALGATLGVLAVKGIAIIVALFLFSRFFLPRISAFFATSQELLFLFSLSWGLGVSALFAVVGFSIEIGALIAGVALSLSPFAIEMGSRLKPLRDFFVTLFFILLGAHMVFDDVQSLVIPALILSLYVVVGKPLIVYLLTNVLGYRRKVGFHAAFAAAQISEFSLILTALALSVGHISQEVASIVTLVAVFTIATSTYLFAYADKMFPYFDWLLKRIDFRRKKLRDLAIAQEGHEILIFGYDRVGTDFVNAAQKLEKEYLVVDYNPRSIERLKTQEIPHRYGDVEDIEFLQELEFASAQLVVSTIPDFRATMLLVRTYRQQNADGIIVVIAHNTDDAKALYEAGASYVVMPHHLGAHYAANMIVRHGFDAQEFERERELHLGRLAKRQD